MDDFFDDPERPKQRRRVEMFLVKMFVIALLAVAAMMALVLLAEKSQ
jgi:predicted nucleic acid-binding Zn ribbon protein